MASSEKLQFTYDYMGRRIQKTFSVWDADNAAFTETYAKLFLYDGFNLVAERTTRDGATSTQTYLWGLDLSGTPQGAGGVGGLLAVSDASGSTYFPSYDGNGNVMGYSNADGASVAKYDYDPFGEPVKATGPKAHEFRFRFSTKYTDPESGQIYYGYRLYDPPSGKWLSRDPIEEQGGINLYGFVDNDAVNQWDILGLYTLSDAVKSLRKKGVRPQIPARYNPLTGSWVPGTYSDTQKFDEWMALERANTGWLDELPPCPRCIDVGNGEPKNPNSKVWKTPGNANPEHAGAVYEMRSRPTPGGHANQCSYDANGMIMTNIPAAGTADFRSTDAYRIGHLFHDMNPFFSR